MEDKVISIMPLPETGYEFMMANKTGEYNESWQVVGIALTDRGRLLPIIYNNVLRTRVFDPDKEKAIHLIDKALKKLEEEKQ